MCVGSDHFNSAGPNIFGAVQLQQGSVSKHCAWLLLAWQHAEMVAVVAYGSQPAVLSLRA